MSTRNESGFVTLVAGEALEPFRRVKLGAGGTCVYADADDLGIGATRDRAAQGEAVTVAMWSTGTVKIEASGAIVDNAIAFASADGKLAGAGSVPVGRNVGTAANGSIQQVFPLAAGGAAVRVSHVVSGAEAAANSGDGRVDFVTGLAAAPRWYAAHLLTATTGAVKSGHRVTALSGQDLGTIRVDGVDSGTQVDENDVIMLEYAV